LTFVHPPLITFFDPSMILMTGGAEARRRRWSEAVAASPRRFKNKKIKMMKINKTVAYVDTLHAQKLVLMIFSVSFLYRYRGFF
jgi:hypothetical protein